MSDADGLIGRIVDGRYRVDAVVGTGGFGTVYAAVHLSLGIKVALKVLRAPAVGDEHRRSALVARFMDEARILTKLRHPNVVAAIDLGSLPPIGGLAGAPYLAMEWVEGRTLKRLLAERGRLPLDVALPLFEGIACGVAHAHEMGIVHRDLKPANVMVLEDGGLLVPRIIDFGVAKAVDPDDRAGSGATRTRSGASAFTPGYAAPEQIAGARTGAWTDVHALGLLFVEMVTGEAPFAEGLGSIDPRRPSAKNKGVDVGALEGVIARCTALRPEDRFTDASALREAWRAAASGIELPPPAAAPARNEAPRSAPSRAAPIVTTPGATEQATLPTTALPGPTSRGRRAWWVVAGVLAGAGLAAALLARAAPSRAPDPAGAGLALDAGAPLTRRLRDLDELELARRLRAAGARVGSVTRSSKHFTVVMLEGSPSTWVGLYRDPAWAGRDPRTVLGQGVRAFAADGDTIVAIYGDARVARAELLERTLAGLPAVVHRE
jgi:eukaryotic-like serine/threonine-protein kinase